MRPFAARPVAAIIAVFALILVISAARYGYHRDELYFLACGRRLAWGYPDQPPLTPLLARLGDAIAPGSLIAFRLPAVLAMLWVVVASALSACELGGAPPAQAIAAVATGSGAIIVLGGHLLSTTTFDVAVWVTLSWLVLRLLRTGQDRLWIACGGVLALGLLNKQLPILLAAALAVGFIAVPECRRALRSRWFWAGGAVALAAWAPVLVWQGEHGWPQLELARQIRDEYGRPGERAAFVALQLVLFSLGATVLWAVGLIRLWRDPAWRRFRPIAWVWPVLMVLLAATAGQGYYPAGIYPPLIAAGAVAAERWSRRRRRLLVAGVLASSALVLPAFLPLLPPTTLDRSPWAGLAEQQLEMVGWTRLADQVAAAYRAIPAGRRRGVTVLAGNYGEAGALERFGPARGLPPVWSGHNGFGLWGPPPDGAAGPVVLVWEGPPPADAVRGCVRPAKVRTGVGNEEQDRASIYLCDGPAGSWSAVWPRLVFLSA